MEWKYWFILILSFLFINCDAEIFCENRIIDEVRIDRNKLVSITT